ncbi:other camkk elm protein kinase [Lentinula edodes]|uniref:non-specific serine/threonine protein kinase n=1 Tax=Lentinula edodes TaxID=5353 RepID=A0A1Q3DWH1_LENED|nr:other camkk elm protein kinase [Lentinula edodes]
MSSFPEASSSCDSQVSIQSYPTLVSNPPPTTAQPAVVTTSLVQTTRLADGKKMINQYVMDAKVGSGQHGNVWRCYENKYYYSYYDGQDPEERERIERQRNSKVLAMKIVKRDNPKARRDRQYKMLRMRGGLGAAGAGANNSGSSAGNAAGASSASGSANGLGTSRPRSTPTVVDGIRTAEQEIRKEIAIMKKCRHPHVVRLYEVIDDRKNEMVFMVMEYLGGGEIQYTSPTSPGTPILTVEQTRRIMRDAILGLEYLHHQGIIHRDIKPANLLWSTGHDRVKIADFGTAHFSYAQRLAAAKASNLPIIDDNEEDPLLLNDADLAKRAGSPAFLAPEIVWEFVEWPQAEKFYPTYTPLLPTTPEGSSPSEPVSADVVPVPAPPRPPVTKSIDIWALGVTLYCLLFGKTPFRPPGDEGDRITEWAGYYWVCNRDWRAEDKMGWDGVLTGGQKAREGQWNGWGWLMNGVTTTETDTKTREYSEGGDSAAKEEGQKGKPEGSKEGALVMHLLDHFLQKDLERRITLEEVKMNPWFLQDLPNPDYWLRMTSPNDSTCPSTPTGITSSPPVPFKTPATSFSDTTSLTDSTASVTHPDAIFPGPSNYPTPPSSSARANSTSGISGTSASGFIVQHTAADEEDPITQFAPIEKIEVTDKERDAAMSAVKFRWRRQGASGEKKKESRGSRVMVGGVSKVTEEVSELQVQKGGLLRISHRISNFLRGAVPSRSRPSLQDSDSTSSHDRTSRVDRTSSKRSSRSSGRRDNKGKDIGDRGPVTSEPNMRLRALRRDDKDARTRERERRRIRGKEEERAIIGTANSPLLSQPPSLGHKPPSVRPSASAPERRLRELGLEDAERTPRLGTRGLPSSAVSTTAAPSPRNKWKVSSRSPVSPSSIRPRPNHALTQPQILGFARSDPRVRSHMKFFVDSDEDARSDSSSLDLDDDNMSLFSDEGEYRRVRHIPSWNQEGGRHPAELDSLEPEQLSPTSPISFSPYPSHGGSDYEYRYDHRYNLGPSSSIAFAPRRRGWDAVSDGDIVDVMSNLDISDDEGNLDRFRLALFTQLPERIKSLYSVSISHTKS